MPINLPMQVNVLAVVHLPALPSPGMLGSHLLGFAGGPVDTGGFSGNAPDKFGNEILSHCGPDAK